MKNLFIYITAFFVLVLSSCSSRTYLDEAQLNSVLNNEEFTFMVERAHPMNPGMINAIGGANSRILDLDYGYTIVVKKEKLEVALPYFGRMFSANMDPDKNSYRFTTENYSLSKSEGKKGATLITIIPENQNVRRIIMEVFKNGRAYVSFDSDDRQPISYDGYLMSNKAKE